MRVKQYIEYIYIYIIMPTSHIFVLVFLLLLVSMMQCEGMFGLRSCILLFLLILLEMILGMELICYISILKIEYSKLSGNEVYNWKTVK